MREILAVDGSQVSPLSCYFDDFVSFAPPPLANNSQAALCLMLDVLGWGFDREGPKSDDYSLLVSALGVKFNLSGCQDGLLRVCNTEKRTKETSEMLDEILERGSLRKKDALMVRSRLAFCDAFIFGRLGKVALQEITRHACLPFLREDFRCFGKFVETFERESSWSCTSSFVVTHVGYLVFAYRCELPTRSWGRFGSGLGLSSWRGRAMVWY